MLPLTNIPVKIPTGIKQICALLDTRGDEKYVIADTIKHLPHKSSKEEIKFDVQTVNGTQTKATFEVEMKSFTGTPSGQNIRSHIQGSVTNTAKHPADAIQNDP